MGFLDTIGRAWSRAKTLWTILGWLGLAGPLAGAFTVAIGTVWAVITGVSAPIIMMAAFCTFTAAIYLALVPMAYRLLVRAQEIAPNARPDPEVWRHLPQYEIFEAACLLADEEPNLGLVNLPGSANGLCRALCIEINNQRILRIEMHYDHLNVINGKYVPSAHTVISRDSLKLFADERGIKRAFLSP